VTTNQRNQPINQYSSGYLVGFAHYIMAALSLVADPACWEEAAEERQPGKPPHAGVTMGIVVGSVLFVVASIEQVRRLRRGCD
jgi:hypothetical protein